MVFLHFPVVMAHFCRVTCHMADIASHMRDITSHMADITSHVTDIKCHMTDITSLVKDITSLYLGPKQHSGYPAQLECLSQTWSPPSLTWQVWKTFLLLLLLLLPGPPYYLPLPTVVSNRGNCWLYWHSVLDSQQKLKMINV